MKVLIVNPIVYTSETKHIKRAGTIKDSMIYDLCLAFYKKGHEVTLYAAEPYQPIEDEQYPFEVIWGKCVWQSVCLPHRLPFMPGLLSYIRKNKEQIDLIISGEVFSLNTLMCVLASNQKLIVWHELAKHNALFRKIPSKFWYNVVARLFMRNTCVVGRSVEAREFIKKYCRNTLEATIDHGVNLEKFQVTVQKKDQFVVCSQLIPRKRIDGIIRNFAEFLEKTGKVTKLYIIGDGESRNELVALTEELGLAKRIKFMGKRSHEELMPVLAESLALLVNTEKDNSMISIVESIAVGTPVVTTDVPLNSSYIRANRLGIVGDWTASDLERAIERNEEFVYNCLEYRNCLSTEYRVEQFLDILKHNRG